ncbi:hypothetical protein [Bradyrhizobium sp. LTSPM299]|jgi:hypothetical protein|uniref:hypothetical protein n=1 Tax=Bradyrhizobium sp. LTSPM299 TaxID=1619233 RepID=UPI0006795246|nr:hypothetical protein [Bradyrhizobium sp. LTSPM299]
MSDYRAYIFGKDGHRFLTIPEFPSDYRDDATAMKAARKLVDGHDIELWDANRLICRFTTAMEKPQTLKDFTAATISGVPSILVVDTEEEPA